MKKTAPTMDEPPCIDCGCTMSCACIGFDGEPCHWISTDPHLCSTCLDIRDMKAAARLLRADARMIRESNTNKAGRWDSPQEKQAWRDRLDSAKRLDEIRAKAGR
jgi:hypothetical protein